jgi:hypothetical protein
MTRRTRFTQAELTRMARTVKNTGVAIEVVQDGATMRILPNLPSPVYKPDKDLDRELEAFEARHGKG